MSNSPTSVSLMRVPRLMLLCLPFPTVSLVALLQAICVRNCCADAVVEGHVAGVVFGLTFGVCVD